MALSYINIIDNLKNNLKLGKDKKEAMLLAVLAFLFILVIYFYLFFRPTLSKLTFLLPRVHSLNMELKNAKLDIANKSLIEDKRISLQSKIDYYEKRLPHQREIPKLLEDLSKMAIGSGVKIVGIKPIETGFEQGSKEGVYQTIPINTEAKCGYHQLGKFIQELEAAARIVRVSNINIEADQSDMTRHNVKLVITTYTLMQEK